MSVQTIEGEVVAVAEKVVGVVKAAVVEIKAEEKLFLSDTELEYLKIQTEIQRLSKLAEEKSKAYQAYVENLFKTYGLDKTSHVFDGAVRIFKAL